MLLKPTQKTEHDTVIIPNTKILSSIIEKYLNKPGALLSILEDAQNAHPHKYLPEKVLKYVAEKMNIPLSQIYSVATFYAFFNLTPQGKHSIVICRGTACHTRGSLELLEHIQSFLGFTNQASDGEGPYTTPDKKYTVKTVACFGQCAMAPVVCIDDVIYGNMTVEKLKKIVKSLK